VGAVAAPERLGLVERRAVADGDERVLQRGALLRVRVDVAGRDARDLEALGELGEQPVAAAVVAGERALQLDPQVVAAEGLQQALGPGGRADVIGLLYGRRHRSVGRAAGQADEALGVAVDLLVGDHRRIRVGRLQPRVAVRGGDQAAEVLVAGARLAQQRQVPARVERDLRPRDRPHPHRLGGDRVLHRAVDAVVVGDRHRRVAVVGSGSCHLDRMRGAVEERERGVRVQLDVAAHRGPRVTRG